MSEQSAESVARKIVEGWYKSLPEDDQCISIGHRRDLRASITAAVESERRERDNAKREAERLCKIMAQKWSNDHPNFDLSAFGLCDSTAGIISQIDNMYAGRMEELVTLRARLEASKKWQRHLDGCPHTFPMAHNPDCTCGLSEHQKGE